MNREPVSMRQLQKICEDFQVDFKLEVQNGSVIYRFGPVGWAVPFQDNFCLEHYIEVVKRLSATFPEKVLRND